MPILSLSYPFLEHGWEIKPLQFTLLILLVGLIKFNIIIISVDIMLENWKGRDMAKQSR